MGTRSDYYVGRGPNAEWIGSRQYDGHPTNIVTDLVPSHLRSKTEHDWRESVAVMLADHDDSIAPGDGWPWPWETSLNTDYAYAFDGGEVWCSCFGSEWFRPGEEEADCRIKKAVFPVMKPRRMVAVPICA